MAKKRPDIPILNIPAVETHCHLDYIEDQNDETISHILEKSRKVGVEKIITISVSPDNLDTVLKIAETHKEVFATQGVHPHEAKLYDSEVEKKILKNITSSKIIAIGEIGLDYHYNHSPQNEQKTAFIKQLEIAIHHDLPIVLHTREADTDTIDILKEYGPKLKRKGVLHSYTSSEELLKLALDLGLYIGFNGIITFKNSVDVRNLAKLVPIEQLLIETDAPFLTPHPYRGVKNAPYYLPFVAEKLAEIKEVSLSSLLKQIHKNSVDLFQI